MGLYPLAVAASRALVAGALELAFPRACAACDAPLRRRAVFCAACAAAVDLAPRVPGALAAASYGGPIARAVHRLKYENRPDIAAQLGELVKARVRDLDVEIVAPVPLHPIRLAERGYNQAALLARPLGSLGLSVSPFALRRVRDTPQQTRLAKRERASNMAGAFVASPWRVRGRRVLVLDDVVTTGATLDACARALEEAGAGSVVRAALAFASL